MLLPQGAEALLIAVQTPAPKGYMGIPVLVWGAPGEGKSSFLEGLETSDFQVLTLIASIHDPTDFSGLPMYRDGMVHYAAPEWVDHFKGQGDGILLLDELTTAPPAVQSALLRLVLERKVGFHPLPPRTRIVAAANPPELMSGGWELSPPLRNRFVHIQWKMQPNVFIDALENGYQRPELPAIPLDEHEDAVYKWRMKVTAFLKLQPQNTTSSPDTDHYGFASPRTWDFAIALMASCDVLGKTNSPVFSTLMSGCVGEGITVAFLQFLKNLTLPDAEAVLLGTEWVNLAKLNESEVFVLFGSFFHVLKKHADHEKTLVKCIDNYFQLCLQVFDLGKRDLIYTSLKKVAKDKIFLQALEAAKNSDEHTKTKVMNGLHGVFDDKGLNEFIKVFTK